MARQFRASCAALHCGKTATFLPYDHCEVKTTILIRVIVPIITAGMIPLGTRQMANRHRKAATHIHARQRGGRMAARARAQTSWVPQIGFPIA
jgi:hypothetical protein